MSRLENIALTGRALGALFYFSPQAPQTHSLVDAFTSGSWLQDWPWADDRLNSIAQRMRLAAPHLRKLDETWQRLFIGPDALPAPPGVPSGLIKKMSCLATLCLRYVAGCNNWVFNMKPTRMNRKTISAPFLCWLPGWRKMARNRPPTNCWRGIYFPGLPGFSMYWAKVNLAIFTLH